jgi:hypothetical protein
VVLLVVQMPQDLSIYIQLIRDFLDRSIPANQFERRFLDVYKSDQTTNRPTETGAALELLFGAVDAYCGDDSLRSQVSGAIDEHALREIARNVLGILEHFTDPAILFEFALDESRDSWPIRAGMSREQVREVIGVPYESFIKVVDFSNEATDSFNEIGIHTFYNAEGKVIGVEIFSGHIQTVVTVNRQNLLGKSASYAKELFSKAGGFELRTVADGIETVDSHIRLFIPDIGDTGEVLVQGIYLVLSDQEQG